jgi:leucyl/phenylalanyl-tRNA--protein transferase
MFLEVEFYPDKPDTPDKVLEGYAKGVFPMGDVLDNSVSWYTANPRGIITFNDDIFKFHIPRSLKQVMKKNIFEIKIDTCFNHVIHKCSEREDTWINGKIIDLYNKLHKMGYAHSVETFYKGKLAGGLYGVALKGAFFGESMFYEYPNASKAAVVRLFEILNKNAFVLFDIQMITSVFEIFNAIYIPRKVYLKLLESAMHVQCNFLLT